MLEQEEVDASVGRAGTRIDLDDVTKRYQVGDVEVTGRVRLDGIDLGRASPAKRARRTTVRRRP